MDYPDFVRPDEFSRIDVEELGESFLVNAKFDRVDYFPMLGHYILKLMDDEQGFISLHLKDEKHVELLVGDADLPLVERDTIMRSEYDNYLVAQTKMLDDDWLDED